MREDRLRAERGAQEFEHADRRRGVGRRHLALEHGGAVLGPELQAIIDHIFRPRFAADAVLHFAEGEVVGEWNELAIGAAEEFVEGFPPGFAADVPERHLDRPEARTAAKSTSVATPRQLGRQTSSAPAMSIGSRPTRRGAKTFSMVATFAGEGPSPRPTSPASVSTSTIVFEKPASDPYDHR